MTRALVNLFNNLLGGEAASDRTRTRRRPRKAGSSQRLRITGNPLLSGNDILSRTIKSRTRTTTSTSTRNPREAHRLALN